MGPAGDELPPIQEVPSAHLEGRDLGNGWVAGPRITKDPGATGGCFSVSYSVTNADGRKAFMKALNFQAAAVGPRSFLDQLHDFTSAFVFERDLLADCGNRKMSRVIRMIDDGQVQVPEAGIWSEVPFLIFELAEGDIRAFQARLEDFDCAWAFRVMKHALEGVSQLHSAHAAHQDLKPSNVLTQDNGAEMKLGDLGNAERRGVAGPCSNWAIPGAVAYAPPEQHYGAFTGSWEERKAADLYLAGSLGVQLFVGNCISVLVQSRLPARFLARNWRGPFEEVLPCLRSAHNAVILAVKEVVLEHTKDETSAHQYSNALAEMTDPDPKRRGHPRDRAGIGSDYAVHRYVSLMDLLASRAHVHMLMEAARGQ